MHTLFCGRYFLKKGIYSPSYFYCLLLVRVNIDEKRIKILIKISKDVAHKLHNEYGVSFKENGISKTRTKHPTYYLCESEYNLTNLLKITSNDEAKYLLEKINQKKNRNKNRKANQNRNKNQ